MPSYDNAVHVMQSINSYFGLMKGTASFNIKKRIAKKVLETFSEWLYFRNKNDRFICVLKSKYKPKKTSYLNLNDYASIFRPPTRYYPKRRLPLQLREPAYMRA